MTVLGVARRAVGWHRPLVVFAGLMVLCAVVSAVGMGLDDRVLENESIWLKPFKFGISLGVYSLTLAWMTSLVQKGKRLIWWLGTIIAALGAAEMAGILLQVARGTASHFNNRTAFDATLFGVMGGLVVALWLANLVVAVVLLVQRFADGPTRWALRLGMVTALVGMAVAFLMTQPTPEQRAALAGHQHVDMIGAHSVGLPDGGPGLPITNWSTVGGDLRVPHFLGIHALNALPLVVLLLGLLARRFPRLRPEPVRTRLTVIAAGGYAGLFGLTLWQALRGQSLIHPDGQTLTALAALIGAVLLATVPVLYRTKTAGTLPTAPATP
ncbi:hypothetical protein GCM10010174_46470 [Kutzneria viridogrisea]|uniref:Uncharacterized protein n=2 Tax=Kutzneria TaxID=43356 RepID=W5W5Q3_9PSEU|nr:hypothetical protein [Kutzneria albida]AHH95801.1 hypothetical protein KALB_2433 [Kutzneria albida DSM 43870]MBA8926679.1 uncharacterized membrane protein YhaH (DUF805 family) [Kutzneria viridogrisea]